MENVDKKKKKKEKREDKQNPHVHLQTITKNTAKFLKDRLKTVRGVESTIYPSYCVYGRTASRTDRRMDEPILTVPFD